MCLGINPDFFRPLALRLDQQPPHFKGDPPRRAHAFGLAGDGRSGPRYIRHWVTLGHGSTVNEGRVNEGGRRPNGTVSHLDHVVLHVLVQFVCSNA